MIKPHPIGVQQAARATVLPYRHGDQIVQLHAALHNSERNRLLYQDYKPPQRYVEPHSSQQRVERLYHAPPLPRMPPPSFIHTVPSIIDQTELDGVSACSSASDIWGTANEDPTRRDVGNNINYHSTTHKLVVTI